ncbi:MAG: helix-turn-helix domain-containing protein [Candidatus Daviesbacteria bacterium]|nr:helix-turn-helix domain-containing protein [Candidatus Daviesbacteria bacterium]
MDKIKLLKQLGLEEKEIQTYLTLLSIGPAKATTIARESNIKRPSTYFVLDRLITKGLVSKSEDRKKELFKAEEPEILLRIAKQESIRAKNLEGSIKKLMQDLKKSYKKKLNSPRIQIFEGLEGLWNIAEDTLKEKKEIYAFGSAYELYSSFSFERLEEYGKRRIRHRIKAYVLTDKHPDSVKEYFRQDFTYQKYHFLPESIKLGTYFLLYGDKTALMSSGQSPMGIIIEDKMITEAIKIMFNALWFETEGKNLPLI